MSAVPVYKATYSGVPVYEIVVRNVAVMRRRHDDWCNATQILKVAEFDKPQRTRILEREVQNGMHEKVQGGYGKYQGTWIPLERSRILATTYNVTDILAPIFDFVPSAESPPPAPKHITAASRAARAKKASAAAAAAAAANSNGGSSLSQSSPSIRATSTRKPRGSSTKKYTGAPRGRKPKALTIAANSASAAAAAAAATAVSAGNSAIASPLTPSINSENNLNSATNSIKSVISNSPNTNPSSSVNNMLNFPLNTSSKNSSIQDLTNSNNYSLNLDNTQRNLQQDNILSASNKNLNQNQSDSSVFHNTSQNYVGSTNDNSHHDHPDSISSSYIQQNKQINVTSFSPHLPTETNTNTDYHKQNQINHSLSNQEFSPMSNQNLTMDSRTDTIPLSNGSVNNSYSGDDSFNMQNNSHKHSRSGATSPQRKRLQVSHISQSTDHQSDNNSIALDIQQTNSRPQSTDNSSKSFSSMNSTNPYAEELLRYIWRETTDTGDTSTSDPYHPPDFVLHPPADFDINAPVDSEGNSALHWSCAVGNLNVAEALVRAGADVRTTNDDQHNIVLCSIKFNNNYDQSSFPFLLNIVHSVTVSISEEISLLFYPDHSRRTILHYLANFPARRWKVAIYYAQMLFEHILKILRDKPEDTTLADELVSMINLQDYEGNTALLIAAQSNFKDFVNLLMEYNSNPNIPNIHRQCALDFMYNSQYQPNKPYLEENQHMTLNNTLYNRAGPDQNNINNSHNFSQEALVKKGGSGQVPDSVFYYKHDNNVAVSSNTQYPPSELHNNTFQSQQHQPITLTNSPDYYNQKNNIYPNNFENKYDHKIDNIHHSEKETNIENLSNISISKSNSNSEPKFETEEIPTESNYYVSETAIMATQQVIPIMTESMKELAGIYDTELSEKEADYAQVRDLLKFMSDELVACELNIKELEALALPNEHGSSDDNLNISKLSSSDSDSKITSNVENSKAEKASQDNKESTNLKDRNRIEIRGNNVGDKMKDVNEKQNKINDKQNQSNHFNNYTPKYENELNGGIKIENGQMNNADEYRQNILNSKEGSESIEFNEHFNTSNEKQNGTIYQTGADGISRTNNTHINKPDVIESSINNLKDSGTLGSSNLSDSSLSSARNDSNNELKTIEKNLKVTTMNNQNLIMGSPHLNNEEEVSPAIQALRLKQKSIQAIVSKRILELSTLVERTQSRDLAEFVLEEEHKAKADIKNSFECYNKRESRRHQRELEYSSFGTNKSDENKAKEKAYKDEEEEDMKQEQEEIIEKIKLAKDLNSLQRQRRSLVNEVVGLCASAGLGVKINDYRKLISLCTGVKADEIDDLLDGIQIALTGEMGK